MEILINVFKKSIIIAIGAAILSALLIEPRKMPLGIMVGWLFGVINLRSLSKNVEGMLGTSRAAMKMLFMNLSRLVMMSVAIFLLVYSRAVDIFGLLFGFSVVFVFILVEGYKVGKSE